MSAERESTDKPQPCAEWLIDLIVKRPDPPAPPPSPTRQTNRDNSELIGRYVDAALRNEQRRVAAAREGSRNATLNNAALALGHFVGAGVLSRAAVEQTLEAASADCGLWREGPQAVRATIASGLTAGIAQPFDISRIGRRDEHRPNGSGHYDQETGEILPDNAEAAIDLAQFEQNDIGNAQRLINQFGDRLRYVVNVGWYAWDGRRWKIDEGEVAVKRFAHLTAKAIFAEVAFLADPKAQEARAKWAISSGYSARIAGMMSQAEPHLALTADDLDKDPWLFNVLNGTIDLRSGNIRAHAQVDLITKLSPVVFNPDALCPTWDSFVAGIFADDPEMVAFTQRALGYSMTGITREHVIFILHGSGSNGKSVLLETVAAILDDYTRQCPSDTFTAKDKGGSGISNDIARLAGARLVSVVETDQEHRLAESLIKQATGGDRMAARYLHHEFFEFTPKFKLWLATNHKPQIRGTDHGIWRRIRLLPFLVTFLDPDKALLGQPVKDDLLKDTLQTELPGILAWIVRGCLDWQDIGLQLPVAVENATSQYRYEQDLVAGFLSDCTEIQNTYSCRVDTLYDVYTKWCTETGQTQLSRSTFGGKLNEKGFATHRGAKGVWSRLGLDLKEEWKPKPETSDPYSDPYNR
jgi:putative DNA primase/helicase